jgi:hypothetical protein
MRHLATTPLRLVVAAGIVAVAAGAAVWVATYRTTEPYTGMGPRVPNVVPLMHTSPAWTTPVAVLLGLAAIGAAALVLRRR